MPKETLQAFESDPKNKIISADEIKKIEEINNYLNPKKTENSETNEWSEQLDNAKIKINQIDDAFLTDIKRQWELILKWIKYEKWKEPTAQQITAMLSLLKIYQMRNPWSIKWDIPLNWNFDTVLNIVWDIPKNFQWFMEDSSEVVAYLDEVFKERKESDKRDYDEGAEKWNIENNWEVSLYKAKKYIDTLIADIEKNWWDSVKSKYQYLRYKLNKDPWSFEKAVNSLLSKCAEKNPALAVEWSFSLSDGPVSSAIQEFQRKAKNEYETWLTSWGLKNWVDGKLWYNTLLVIQKVVDIVESDFKPAEREVKLWESTERKLDWKEAEKYPDNVKRILSMWEFWADGKFKFYNWEKGKDYVQHDDNWNFVNIWWERYYIDWECGDLWDEFNKFKQEVKPYMWYDEHWNEKVLYKRILSFWKIHKNWMFEWTKVTIDWNEKQVKSQTFDAPKERTIWDKKVPSSIVDVKIWNKIDDKWDFKWKWRIDLFTDKDKKTLNEKELNSLDKNDILAFLNKAINNYKETNHKPSWIWQANLNLVIDLAIRELRKEDNRAVLWELIKNADPSTWYFAKGLSPEERVSKFLNLDPGLYSNPDNIINKNNLEWEELKKYNSLETNAEKRKYRSTLKQWDRIINRLKLLQKALEWKTDTEPSTTKSETEVNKQEEIIDSAIWNLASSSDDVRDKIWGWKLKDNIPWEKQDQNEWVVSVVDDDTPSQEKEKTINNQDVWTFWKLEANIQYNLNKYKIGSTNQGAFIYLWNFSWFDNNMIHILNEYNWRVWLDWRKINSEMISQLTNWPKQISISWNIDNSNEALLNSLKNIWKIDRWIFLPHLNNINGNMCEYLTTWWRVSLEWLKTIDSDSLRVLGTSKINHLALGHVDITNQEDVRNLLKNYDWRLSLNSIPEIDVDAAKWLENQKNTVKINSVGKLDLTDENILKSLWKMKTKLVINNVENIIVDENKKQEYMEKYNITISWKKIIVNNNLNHF